MLTLLIEAQMFELTEIVIPKIMDKWERLAYRMRYKAREVEVFKKDSHDLRECCTKLFIDWLETGHDPTPKTYQTLLHYIKQIKDLTAASEEIERELIEGKGKQIFCTSQLICALIYLLQLYTSNH